MLDKIKWSIARLFGLHCPCAQAQGKTETQILAELIAGLKRKNALKELQVEVEYLREDALENENYEALAILAGSLGLSSLPDGDGALVHVASKVRTQMQELVKDRARCSKAKEQLDYHRETEHPTAMATCVSCCAHGWLAGLFDPGVKICGLCDCPDDRHANSCPGVSGASRQAEQEERGEALDGR